MTQLDNPVWNALITIHQEFALGTLVAKRYPANVLPFVSFNPIAVNPIRSLDTVMDVTRRSITFWLLQQNKEQ